MSKTTNNRLSMHWDARKSGAAFVGGLILIASLVASCSGGSGASSNAAPQPSINNPPTISGSPTTSVTEGQPYSFTPLASDPDGDTLTFSIASEPSWASFDPGSGSLSGIPDSTDVGSTVAVTISVSDGKASASLAPFDLEVAEIQLGSATVSWDIPSTNADGSSMNDLAGFTVHYGDAAGTYTRMVMINDAVTNSILIENLEPGMWFFAVTARDLASNESAYSLEVSKVINP